MKATHKFQSRFITVTPSVIVAIFILACGGGAIVQSTPTPLPTSTSPPKPTSTPKPTATPVPTATEVPPTPTPAPVGVTVVNEKYEVTVVKVRKLETVYLDDFRHWVANPGYAFLEIGAKVKNLQGDTVEVPWGNIYIIDANGSAFYPNWGGVKSVESGIEVNPPSIVFYPIDNREDKVSFGDVLFLRLIYAVEKNEPSTTVLFGFDDSPLIEVTLP